MDNTVNRKRSSVDLVKKNLAKDRTKGGNIPDNSGSNLPPGSTLTEIGVVFAADMLTDDLSATTLISRLTQHPFSGECEGIVIRDRSPHKIVALCSHNNRVYDAVINEIDFEETQIVVRETSSNNVVTAITSDSSSGSLCSHNNKLYFAMGSTLYHLQGNYLHCDVLNLEDEEFFTGICSTADRLIASTNKGMRIDLDGTLKNLDLAPFGYVSDICSDGTAVYHTSNKIMKYSDGSSLGSSPKIETVNERNADKLCFHNGKLYDLFGNNIYDTLADKRIFVAEEHDIQKITAMASFMRKR